MRSNSYCAPTAVEPEVDAGVQHVGLADHLPEIVREARSPHGLPSLPAARASARNEMRFLGLRGAKRPRRGAHRHARSNLEAEGAKAPLDRLERGDDLRRADVAHVADPERLAGQRPETAGDHDAAGGHSLAEGRVVHACLLYTSDAADEEDSVDLG